MLEVFLVLIKFLSIVLNIVGVIIFYAMITDKKNYMYYLSPKWIYDNSKLNIFGTILLFFCFNVVNSNLLYFMVYLLVMSCRKG